MNSNPSVDPRQFHHDAVLVDLHAHPGIKAVLFNRDLARRFGISRPAFWPYEMRTNFDRLRAGGVDVMLSAAIVPEQPLLEDMPALRLLRYTRADAWRQLVDPTYFQATLTVLDALEMQVAASQRNLGPQQRRIVLARSIAELEAALQLGPAGPIALVHAVEGGHSLEGPLCRQGLPDAQVQQELLDNLQVLFQRGVACLTLAHFFPNRITSSVFPYPETVMALARWRQAVARYDLSRGLTPLGEAVVERMLELGMLIDLTHSTPLARDRVYQIVDSHRRRSAVLATHVGVFAHKPHPYSLSDWEIRWLADRGGVAGVIFMNYWLSAANSRLGLDLIANTLRYLIETAGTDAVAAIGSDFDGFTDPPDDLVDASEMPRLTRHLMGWMKEQGQPLFAAETLRKILGGNALRLLREGWRRK